jgi:two-component system sensor histidine kinase AlgZ
VLQPLLENAVVHGIARLAQGGDIDITMKAEEGMLQIHISNPSLPASQRDASNGHAQDSIAQRLAYRFGREARMTSRQIDGYYCRELLLRLP